MSQFIEYKGFIIKISNKILNTFQNYSIEQQKIAHHELAHRLYDFNCKYQNNNLKIYKNGISYFNNVIDFSKYDKKFKNKLINQVIIFLNDINTKPIINQQTLFTKCCDFIEN